MSLRIEQRDRVVVATLDDPERRNALTTELVTAIVDAVDDAEADESVGALVVTGADPAFCAGADLGDLASLGGDGAESALRAIYEGFLRVYRSHLPVVAAVNGPAVGAGFNLALAADVRVASPSARFDARFTQIGLHPGGGHTWLLERAVGPQVASSIVLFGERLDGAAAAQRGLVLDCVEHEHLVDRAVALAAHAARAPRDLNAKVKATLREVAFQPDFDAAVDTEVERQVWSVHATRELPPSP